MIYSLPTLAYVNDFKRTPEKFDNLEFEDLRVPHGRAGRNSILVLMTLMTMDDTLLSSDIPGRAALRFSITSSLFYLQCNRNTINLFFISVLWPLIFE